MKLRNINISTLILLALLLASSAFFVTAQENSATTNNVFLDSDQDGLTDAEEKLYGTDAQNPDTDGDSYSDGAEVKANYDPLKKAPGDELAASDIESQLETLSTEELAADDDNLTRQVAEKISTLASQTDPDNQETSMEEIQQVVNDSLGSQSETITLPQIDRETIHIKEQNYKESEEEERKKEDFSNYIAAVFYIFTSNSPSPITSSSDITSVMSQTAGQLISAISTQDPETLENLSQSGEAILGQLKEVEVPEDLVDLHIKAMQYATYAESLKDLLKSDPEDPLASVVNFSQIGAFIQSLSSFFSDAESKLNEYDVDYGDIQDKMQSMGVELPGLDELESVTGAAASDTSAE